MKTMFLVGYGFDIAQLRAEHAPWREWPVGNFDRFDPATWIELYAQAATVARINGLAPVLRGVEDVGFQALTHLKTAAMTTHLPPSYTSPTFSPFVDTAALGDVVSRPGEPIAFDFENPAHLELVWTNLLRPFFQLFDGSSSRLRREVTPHGGLLVTWWGINPGVIGQGMHHWESAQMLLDHVSQRMRDDGMGETDHIVDTSWPGTIKAYGKHAWFNPPTAWSANTYKGVTVGVAVPGFHDPPGSTMNRTIQRRNGNTLRDAFAGWRRAGATYGFLESLTNIEESAGFYLSDAWTPNSLYLNIVREHVELTLPPVPIVEVDSMLAATFVISRKDTISTPSKPGYFTARFPTGSQETVLSVQPDGTLQTRPMGTVGSYEEFREEGNRAVFPDVAGFSFAIPLVD